MDFLTRISSSSHSSSSSLCQRTLLILLLSVYNISHVLAAAASEWSMGPSEEYVSAFINLTYLENKKLHTEKSETGRFGNGKVGAASGLVVHVFGSNNRTDVHHGCEYPYGNQLPNEPWIALVKRGNCSFDKKLENAFRSNASALVVYAKEDSEQLEKMSFRNCDYCDIPSVFTYKWKGEEIAKKVDGDIKVYMYITVGETCTRPYSGINRTSVLFVSISFIVLMIISLCWLCFYYLQRFRYLHAKDRLAQRLCNAAKKALAKIPTRKVKMTDKEICGEGDCCAVCIELYRPGDTLRTLPCNHEYHQFCIDPWLLEHRTCPMCKMDILKYYGFIQFTGSQESILHLDMEDAVLNSSESRETDSPVHETQQQQRHHHIHHHTSASDQSDDQQPHSSVSVFPERHRKTSLISLTVVATPRALSYCRSNDTPDTNAGDSQKQCFSPPTQGTIMFQTVELNAASIPESVSRSSLNDEQHQPSSQLTASADDSQQRKSPTSIEVDLATARVAHEDPQPLVILGSNNQNASAQKSELEVKSTSDSSPPCLTDLAVSSSTESIKSVMKKNKDFRR